MRQFSRLLFLLLVPVLFSCRQNTHVVTDLYTFQDNVFTIRKGDGQYRILALSPDIFRVTYLDSLTREPAVYAPVLETPVEVRFRDRGDRITLSTDEVVVEVRKEPVQLAFRTVDGGVKLSEEAGFQREADTTSFRFMLQEGEKIHGLGFRALPLDRRGYRFQHNNQPQYGYGVGAANLNYSMPHLVSSEKYMLLFDNPALGYFDVGKTEADVLEFSTLRGNHSYYFVNGDNYPELLRAYVDLTGHQEVPPLWAFGHLQSRFGYHSQAQTEEMVDRALAAGYPVDAVIVDLYWFSEEIQDGLLGNLSWDTARWPDPEGMIARFREKGVKTIIVTEPFFVNTSTNYDYLAENGLLAKNPDGSPGIISDFYFGPAGLIDLFLPEAREWFWGQYLEEKQKGVAAWWGDLGEPEKHPDTLVHAIGTAAELHNLYGHEWVKMLYENTARDFPDERFFMLARAGYAGSQRFGIVPWSGDVGRSWSGYRAQLPIMLSMGLSGLGYMHSDAGGFTRVETADTALYIRWMQCAAFSPVFRPHSDESAPPEPVLWPPQVQKNIKPFIEWRYRLLPYFYSLGWENYRTGLPLVRPFFLYYESDERAAAVEDAYLLGRNLLVAPILYPDTTGRAVYLPPGEWYDWWTMQRLAGSQEIVKEVGLDQMPLYVRAGTILPTTPLVTSTDRYRGDSLTLTYYCPAGDSQESISLYFDDGITKRAFSDQQYDRVTIGSKKTGNALTFALAKEGKGYEGAPGQRSMRMALVGCPSQPSGILIDQQASTFEWDPERKLATFLLSFGQRANVVVTF